MSPKWLPPHVTAVDLSARSVTCVLTMLNDLFQFETSSRVDVVHPHMCVRAYCRSHTFPCGDIASYRCIMIGLLPQRRGLLNQATLPQAPLPALPALPGLTADLQARYVHVLACDQIRDCKGQETDLGLRDEPHHCSLTPCRIRVRTGNCRQKKLQTNNIATSSRH